MSSRLHPSPSLQLQRSAPPLAATAAAHSMVCARGPRAVPSLCVEARYISYEAAATLRRLDGASGAVWIPTGCRERAAPQTPGIQSCSTLLRFCGGIKRYASALDGYTGYATRSRKFFFFSPSLPQNADYQRRANKGVSRV